MPRILSIEGNIGSGKSTFIQNLKHYFKNNNSALKIQFLEEPVSIWNNIKDKDGNNIIQKFYENPDKYAFSFQMLAYISRLSQLNESIQSNKYDVIICERSIFTDKNVFAKMLYEKGSINEIEYKIYNKWFNEFNKNILNIEYIYIKTDPQIAYERIKKRNRKGETMDSDYIVTCHQFHEQWFLKDSISPIIIDGNIDTNTSPRIIDTWINTVKDMLISYTLMFDGAAKGNPGKSGCGFVIKLDNELIYHGYKYLNDRQTNNYAEYCGLILGLEKCLELNIKNVNILGDSTLVIKQINKEYSISSDNLSGLYNKVLDLLSELNSFTIKHIERKLNHEADRLANLAIYQHMSSNNQSLHNT